MEELYILSLIGKFNSLLQAVLGISLAFTVFSFICWSASKCSDSSTKDREFYNKYIRLKAKAALAIAIISALLLVALPTKEEAFLIYGGGTVIDYMQNSEEVKKIPDNAVKALNTWLESVQKDE
jgi:hypothetical protein